MSPPVPDTVAAVLEHAWELRNQCDFQALCRFLSPGASDVPDDPDLGFLRAEALFHVGRWDESLSHVRQLWSILPPGSDRRLLRRAVNLEATLLLARGEVSAAEERFERVLDTALVADDELHIAIASLNLGIVADIRSRWQDAISSYTRALAAYQRLGSIYGVAHGHHNLGITYRQLGLLRQANMHFERAVSHFAVVGNEGFIASCEAERALVVCMLGDTGLACVLARRGHGRYIELGHAAGEGNSLWILGIVAVASGNMREARDHLWNGLGKARLAGDRLTEAQVLEELAVLEMLEGNPEQSAVRAEEAGRIYRGMGAERRAERMEERLREVAGTGTAPGVA